MTVRELIYGLVKYAEKYGDDTEVKVLHYTFKDDEYEYTRYEAPDLYYAWGEIFL